MVHILNKIPFVSTIESCSGHLKNEINVYNEGRDLKIESDNYMKFIENNTNFISSKKN